jgi:hypothetical protein
MEGAMKGTIFVELLSMAEEALGEVAVDAAIARCPLASQGAYTTVGNYPPTELSQLVNQFSQTSGATPETLERQFGHWMLGRFLLTYPAFFEGHGDAFSMLESIEGKVHAEVRKLYPDSELPTLETVRIDERTMRFTYRSPRRLIAFCHGMIEACLLNYGETASIVVTDKSTPVLGMAEFLISREAA